MHYFAAITTKNSLYTVESAQSNGKLVRCVFGTFQGETWLLTSAQWEASRVQVGQPATFVGACHTSTVQDFQEFYVPTHAERCQGNILQPVIDHVIGIMNPQVMMVDDL